MTTASRIAQNTAVATGARVLGTALSFVSIALIARSLGVTAFGHYTLILSFLFTFQIIADGGLYTLLLREISRPNVDEIAITSAITTLRVVMLVIVLGAAPFVVWLLPYDVDVSLGVAVAAIGFFFLSFSQLLMAVFQRALRMTHAALAEIAGRIAQFAAIGVVVVTGGSLFFFLWALVAGAAVQWFINYRYARRIIPFSFQWDVQRWKRYLRQTAPIAVSVVLTMIYFRIDSIFLSLPFINTHSPDPLLDVGYYGVAYKVFEALIFYPTMFVGLLMPFFSRFVDTDMRRLRSIARLGSRALFIVAVPAVAGLWYLAEPITVLVGGADFRAAAPLLRLLSFALGFVFFGALFGNMLIALRRQAHAAWIYGIGAAINVVANILVIPHWRALGAAWTTVGTEIFVTIAMGVLVAQHGVQLSWNRLPAIVVAATAMMAVLWFVHGGVVVSVALGGVVYSGVLWALGGVTRKELALILGRPAVDSTL